MIQMLAAEVPKGQFHYKFKLADPATFEMALACNVEGILTKLFQQSAAFASRPGGVSLVQAMDIPENMYNLVKSVIYGKVKEIGARTARDKIKLLDFQIEHARYEKIPDTKDQWIFIVNIKGDCQDDRIAEI